MIQQDHSSYIKLLPLHTKFVITMSSETCRKVDLSYGNVFENSNLLGPKNAVLFDDCLKELSTVTELKKILFLKDA